VLFIIEYGMYLMFALMVRFCEDAVEEAGVLVLKMREMHLKNNSKHSEGVDVPRATHSANPVLY